MTARSELVDRRQEGLMHFIHLLSSVRSNLFISLLLERLPTFRPDENADNHGEGHYLSSLSSIGEVRSRKLQLTFSDYFKCVLEALRKKTISLESRIQCLSLFHISFCSSDAALLRECDIFPFLRDIFAPSDLSEGSAYHENEAKKEDLVGNIHKKYEPLEEINITTDRDGMKMDIVNTTEAPTLSHDETSELRILRSSAWNSFRLLAFRVVQWPAIEGDIRLEKEVELLRVSMFDVICNELRRLLEKTKVKNEKKISEDECMRNKEDAASHLFEIICLLHVFTESDVGRDFLGKSHYIEMLLSVLKCEDDGLVSPRSRLGVIIILKCLLPSSKRPKSSWISLFLKEIGRWRLLAFRKERKTSLGNDKKRSFGTFSQDSVPSSSKRFKKSTPKSGPSRSTMIPSEYDLASFLDRDGLDGLEDGQGDFASIYSNILYSSGDGDEEDDEIEDEDDHMIEGSESDGSIEDYDEEISMDELDDYEDEGDEEEEQVFLPWDQIGGVQSREVTASDGDDESTSLLILHSWAEKPEQLLACLRSFQRKRTFRLEKLSQVIEKSKSRGEALLDKGTPAYCRELGLRLASYGAVTSIRTSKHHVLVGDLPKKANQRLSDSASSTWISSQIASSFSSELVSLVRMLIEPGASLPSWVPLIQKHIEKYLVSLPDVFEEISSDREIDLERLYFAFGALSIIGGYSETIRIGGKVLVPLLSQAKALSKGVVITPQEWVRNGTSPSATLFESIELPFQFSSDCKVRMDDGSITVEPIQQLLPIAEVDFNPKSILFGVEVWRALVSSLQGGLQSQISSSKNDNWKEISSFEMRTLLHSELLATSMKAFSSLLRSENALGVLHRHLLSETQSLGTLLASKFASSNILASASSSSQLLRPNPSFTLEIQKASELEVIRSNYSQAFVNSYDIPEIELASHDSGLLLLPSASSLRSSMADVLPHFPNSSTYSILPFTLEKMFPSNGNGCLFLDSNSVEVCPRQNDQSRFAPGSVRISQIMGRVRSSSSTSTPSATFILSSLPYSAEVDEIYFEVSLTLNSQNARDSPAPAVGLIPAHSMEDGGKKLSWGKGSYRMTATGSKVTIDSVRGERIEDYGDKWEKTTTVGVHYRRSKGTLTFSLDGKDLGIAFRSLILFVV